MSAFAVAPVCCSRPAVGAPGCSKEATSLDISKPARARLASSFLGRRDGLRAAAHVHQTSFSCVCVATPPRDDRLAQAREAALHALEQALTVGSHSLHSLLSTVQHRPFAPAFKAKIDKLFPGAVYHEAFVNGSVQRLAEFGFSNETSIPVVCMCRDELCQPFFRRIEDAWTTPDGAGAFDLSGLAGIGGLLSGGITAFGAAEGHAPQTGSERREKYVFFAFLHIAVGEDGTVGSCMRAGRRGVSHACGALCAIEARYKNGLMEERPALDMNDVEESLLAQLIFDRLGPGGQPSLAEITMAAAEAQGACLQRFIDKSTAGKPCDYAVFTGVEIHGPHHADLMYPLLSYAVVDGVRHDV